MSNKVGREPCRVGFFSGRAGGKPILGGMTLAVPGATGFVALGQRAVIGYLFHCLMTGAWRGSV